MIFVEKDNTLHEVSTTKSTTLLNIKKELGIADNKYNVYFNDKKLVDSYNDETLLYLDIKDQSILLCTPIYKIIINDGINNNTMSADKLTLIKDLKMSRYCWPNITYNNILLDDDTKNLEYYNINENAILTTSYEYPTGDFDITIKTLTGSPRKFSVNKDTCVLKLKENICDVMGITANWQSLYFKNSVRLEDEKTIFDNKVIPNSNINLIINIQRC